MPPVVFRSGVVGVGETRRIACTKLLAGGVCRTRHGRETAGDVGWLVGREVGEAGSE